MQRFFRLFFILSFTTCAAAVQAVPSTDHYQTQRETYAQLQERLAAISHRKAIPKKLIKDIDAIKDYPLAPYLALTIIKRNIAKRPLSEINQFLKTYKKLPFTHSLRIFALRAKYKTRRWQDVIALYQPGDRTSYHCMQLTALYKAKQSKQAFDGVNQVWLSGNSLPKTCDNIIRKWKKAGHQSSDITLQRIELTLIKRQGRLAKYLAKSLNKKDAATYKYWKKLYNKPALLSQDHYWDKRGHYANVMLKIAIERLTYQSISDAITLEYKLNKYIGFTEDTRNRLQNNIALRALLKDHKTPQHWLKKFSWSQLNTAKKEQVLRYLVENNQWRSIASLHNTHYKALDTPIEWQYWYASSLAKLGQADKANKLYEKIATKRRYYGFLASDKLGINYSLNHRPLKKDQALIDILSANANLVRAKEFYLLGSDLPARREWYQLVKPLSQDQRLAASHVAHQWGWHNRAIITLTMTEQRDDLDLRFPMPHREQFITQAKSKDMKLSWPIAIARQESAFMTQATSSAGAKGLMQLMPGTAKLQAKRDGVLYQSRQQLLDPAFNIKLGTAYLSEMLDRFDNNLAVAAAAYNAGPHRVKHWIKNSLAQDQWIESIPYRETRSYVKNVLAYSVIYQHQLAQTKKMPSAAINPQRMAILNK